METQVVNDLLEVKESYQASDKMLKLMLDTEQRETTFKKFLEVSTDMSKDWFNEYFQAEHADRKGFKQDFTPASISRLLNDMTLDETTRHYYEPACGSGSLLIKAWYKMRNYQSPFTYDPRAYWYHAEELSDRAMPFLLFNMAIRGMNGVVLHGDVISREFHDVYFIRNDSSNYLAFSDVIVMPKTKTLMQEYDIRKWI